MTEKQVPAKPLTMALWPFLLLLLAGTAIASVQGQKKTSAPATGASHQSKPAPTAQHAAPAQRPSGSHSGAQQPQKPSSANANRSGATGSNKAAPANANRGNPSGANKTLPANAHRGNPTGPNKGGSRYQPAGSKTVVLKQGGTAVYRGNGQVRTIQTHGMTINRGMHGSTRIVSTRHGTTVVSYGRGVGYSQRSYYSHGGRVYVQRTYYVSGRYYAYGYRSYTWGGRPYYGYAPPYYWGPTYYRWAYNPWPAPVYYSWGWGPAPWYGYYGPYFAPYPVYPTAAFWLTDYLIAANLQAAYAAQQAAQSRNTGPEPLATDSAGEIASLWTTDPLIAANLVDADMGYMLGGQAQAATGNATQLSPEVKQAIADEMKNEIAAEQTAAASGKKDTPSTDQIPAALDPKIRIFVVSSDEDLTTAEGVECALTPGDVVYRVGDKPDDDNMVDATVKSSKKDECAVGATVGVDTGDLQEMHNQLRIQMDAGLKELADKQGKNGLPAAPDTKTQAGEVPPPKPDESVGSELQEQQKEAAQAEAQLPN